MTECFCYENQPKNAHSLSTVLHWVRFQFVSYARVDVSGVFVMNGALAHKGLKDAMHFCHINPRVTGWFTLLKVTNNSEVFSFLHKQVGSEFNFDYNPFHSISDSLSFSFSLSLSHSLSLSLSLSLSFAQMIELVCYHSCIYSGEGDLLKSEHYAKLPLNWWCLLLMTEASVYEIMCAQIVNLTAGYRFPDPHSDSIKNYSHWWKWRIAIDTCSLANNHFHDCTTIFKIY